MGRKDRPRPRTKQAPIHSLLAPGGFPLLRKRQRLLKASGKAAERALMEKAQEMIEQTPEIRAEKVKALKAAVEEGTYQIDSRRLANILLAILLTED